jgi:hypothetical protein
MDMGIRAWRFIGGSMLVAAFAVFGGTAQGSVIYDVGYDPPTGFGQVGIEDACLAQEDGTYSQDGSYCQLDLIHVDLVSLGFEWGSGEVDFVGIQVHIVNHELTDFSTVAIPLECLDCDGSSLRTFSVATQDEVTCGPNPGDLTHFLNNGVVNPDSLTGFQGCDIGQYHILGRAVPEPGSLALVGGAIGAAWWIRRRRRNA